MNTLRNPYLATVLSFLVLFVSCNSYDAIDSNQFDGSSYLLAKSQLNNFSNNQKTNRTLLEEIEMNEEIMDYLQEENNISHDFDEILFALNPETTEVKFGIAIETGFINQTDLPKLTQLATEIENNGFDVGMSNFEQTLLNENISVEKFEKYNLLVQSLKLTNDLDFTIFQIDTTSKVSFDCVLATIAFAAACVGLATLEVGTGGLATAVVIVGYITASTAWVRACK